MCWITSAAASAPSCAAVAMVAAARQPEQEARREQVAGAGGVDHLLDRRGRHRVTPSLLTTTQPFSLRVTTASLASSRKRLAAGVEIGGLVEAVQLAFVGEHQIDRAGADQVDELARDSGRRRTHPTSVSATLRPASCAILAALRNASLACGGSHR